MHPLRAVLEALVPAAQAHEKWFVATQPVNYAVPEFYRTVNPYTVGAVMIVVVISVAGYFVDRWYEKTALYARFEKKLRPWRDYAPGVLAFTTGFTLLFLASRGQLLATNYPLEQGFSGGMLRSVEGLIGVLLMIGLFTPAAAVGLLALYLSTFLLQPFIEPWDYANFAGIGIFLLYFARGRYSLDWFLGKPIMTTPEQRKWAYVALRVLTGVTIFWLGVLKLRRPDLHLTLLDKFPDLNPYVLMPWIGIRMSREAYVFCLAVFEATVGIFEAMGFLTRLSAVVLVPVFCASIVFLGPAELVGHLPILGTLFVLFIYGDTYQKSHEPDRYAKVQSAK
ncbi:MAG TPA: TQO small subunit DoxD [Candidatus Eisenbacteria bacterium]|nr:TQO small subunit DoxD [Candidatus Eisenbacteria bacterium]